VCCHVHRLLYNTHTVAYGDILMTHEQHTESPSSSRTPASGEHDGSSGLLGTPHTQIEYMLVDTDIDGTGCIDGLTRTCELPSTNNAHDSDMNESTVVHHLVGVQAVHPPESNTHDSEMDDSDMDETDSDTSEWESIPDSPDLRQGLDDSAGIVDPPASKIVVTVRKPATGAVCPISLDTVEHSQVDGFEGFMLDPAYPEYTEVVLPCKHSFSACYLVVAWLTTPMRCPLCRHGADVSLNPESLPGGWNKIARDHITRIANIDRSEQVSNDYEEALLHHGMDTATNIQLYMCIYIVHTDGTVHSSVVQFSQNTAGMPESPLDNITMTVTRAHVRLISALLRHEDCIAVDMVVFARLVGEGVELVEVANSGMFSMPTRMDNGSEDPPIVHPHPTRNFVMNRQSTQRDASTPADASFFTMVWQQHPNAIMDTMTDITFNIRFVDLAVIVGGLFIVSNI